MNKTCPKCNNECNTADRFCDRCGFEFTEQPNNMKSDVAEGAVNIQSDNRYFKGDQVNAAGDNFTAQTVDKRTVTTNIHNIHNIVDETKKVVQCELSGRRVLQLETATCPSCKRCVSLAYYVERARLCDECYEKKLAVSPPSTPVEPVKPAAASSVPESKAGIPSMINRPDTPRVNVPIEPIKNDGTKRSKRWMYIAAAVVVAGGAFWFMSNTPQQPDISNADIPVVTDDSSVSTESAPPISEPESTTSTTVTPSVVKTPTASVVKQPAAVETADQFTLGKQAFDAGNYTKASVLLEQALGSGKYAAAYYLALMHQQGKGVGKNVRKAFGYMKQSAENGYTAAYYDLAEMYRTGIGTEPNRSLAKGWYEKAVAIDAANADKAAESLSKFYR